MKKALLAVGLLVGSNTFMNLAWYGHLKFKSAPLVVAVLASWGIALAEYSLQVPANRIGNEVLSVTQLKIIQEVISLTTFAVVAVLLFREKPTLNHAISFVLIVGVAYFGAKK